MSEDDGTPTPIDRKDTARIELVEPAPKPADLPKFPVPNVSEKSREELGRKPRGYCTGCGAGIYAMIHMDKRKCAACESADRDAKKVESAEEELDRIGVPRLPETLEQQLGKLEVMRPAIIIEDPQSRQGREVIAQFEHKSALDDAEIAGHKEHLDRLQELVEQLRIRLHGMTNERNEAVKLGQAGQVLIDGGEEERKRLTAELVKRAKLLEEDGDELERLRVSIRESEDKYTKLVEAKGVLKAEIGEDPYRRPADVSDKAQWRGYALELEAHLLTVGEGFKRLETELSTMTVDRNKADELIQKLQGDNEKAKEILNKEISRRVLGRRIVGPYKRPGVLADKSKWEDYALELEAHLTTAGEHIQDLGEDVEDWKVKAKLNTVDAKHVGTVSYELWNTLFMAALNRVPEPDVDVSPDVAVKALVRAACRLADEMFANVSDYKKGRES